jgi:hypothetical protein
LAAIRAVVVALIVVHAVSIVTGFVIEVILDSIIIHPTHDTVAAAVPLAVPVAAARSAVVDEIRQRKGIALFAGIDLAVTACTELAGVVAGVVVDPVSVVAGFVAIDLTVTAIRQAVRCTTWAVFVPSSFVAGFALINLSVAT